MRKVTSNYQDQEKIIKAINENDLVALWREVNPIGYKQVPSQHKRKLIFLKACDKFDPDKMIISLPFILDMSIGLY